MAWEIEVTDEFMRWYDGLSEREQDDIEAIVDLLTEQGPSLPRPHSDHVRDSRHSNMRELRVQSGGDPYRIFYAFDPRRNAILLIGGNKRGNNRFYVQNIPVADNLYDVYLHELREEGLIQ